MAGAAIEVSGSEAQRWAGELQRLLSASDDPGMQVGPVEVERSADLVVAVIGLVFSGVGTAKTIQDWWQARRKDGVADGVKVTVVLEDGSRVEVSGTDGQRLELEFGRATGGTEPRMTS